MTHRWCFPVLTLALVGVSPAAAEPRIAWRLENTFRFFSNPADTERMRAAYAALPAAARAGSPIQSAELALAGASGGQGWATAIVDGPGGLGKATAEEACWFQARACSDYVKPKVHKILAKVSGLETACTWRVKGGPTVRSSACAKEVALTIPYPAGAEVTVEAQGAAVAQETIKVEDLLVVSIGDSFASGEGNPDKPVFFDSAKVLDYGPEKELRGYPVRKGLKLQPSVAATTGHPDFVKARAHWLNRGCHRSLYSQHLRVALQLALDDETQRRAVTYVGVSCTGAEVVEGLFSKWGGHEPAAPAERTTIGQLSGVSNALCGAAATTQVKYDFTENGLPASLKSVVLSTCPKAVARPIDLLLLSIGGNDVGFSGLVLNSALSLDSFSSELAKAFGGTIMLTPAMAAARSESLRRAYWALSRAIKDVLHVDDPAKVVLNAYPLMANDESGKPCQSGKAGMDVTRLFGLKGAKAAQVETYVRDTLNPLMEQSAKAHGWRYADAHRAKFKGHGLCAVSSAEQAHASLTNAVFPRRIDPKEPDTIAVLALPKRAAAPGARARPKRGSITPAPAAIEWPSKFKPSDFEPYRPRQRWFRTPNDAFLTAHMHDDSYIGPEIVTLTRYAGYSGAFHPTAEGHAVIADGVLVVAREAAANAARN